MKAIRCIFSVLILAALAACSEASDSPIYMPTAERLHKGSVLYAQANCQRCHGTTWDGTGPDAAKLKQQGFQIADFNTVKDPSKTVTGYFKAVSDPSTYFAARSAKVSPQDYQDFVAAHGFPSITDAGRWAIANFLYSRAPMLDAEKEAERRLNNDKALAEARAAYDKARKWEIGFKPLAEREKAPGTMPAAARPVESIARVSISAERRALGAEDSLGANLYRNNCARCHGRHAEGTYGDATSGIRFGLRDCPEQNRRCAVFAEIPDLTAAGRDEGAVRNAHKNASSVAPAFASFTDTEWNELAGYIRRLTGK